MMSMSCSPSMEGTEFGPKTGGAKAPLFLPDFSTVISRPPPHFIRYLNELQVPYELNQLLTWVEKSNTITTSNQ